MASQFPCPEFQRDCECEPFPVRNFSQETPDVPVFLCEYHQPVTAGTFFSNDCVGFCESEISEEDCIECATRAALECPPEPPREPQDPNDPNNPFGPPLRPIFLNGEQSCVVECPDGTTFEWTVPAGTVSSFWQRDANARAEALACKRATEHRVCFTTDAELANACVDDFSSIVIGAQGGDSPYTFALTSGALPTGMSFDPVGIITGIPTSSGLATFEITVTDAIGSTQTKEFTLRAIEITSPSTLPNATLNSAYSETLTSAGGVVPVSWAITAGALPTGMSMPASGVISGTPTVIGTYNFTATLTDADDNSCSKDFSIEVEPVVPMAAYWTFQVQGANDVFFDSTVNDVDFEPFLSSNLIVGKIGNAMEITSAGSMQLIPAKTAAFFTNLENGFTIAGWFRTLADAVGTGPIWTFNTNSPGDLLLILRNGGILEWGDFPDIIQVAWPQDSDWHFYRVGYDPDTGKLKLQIDNGTVSEVAFAQFTAGTFCSLMEWGSGVHTLVGPCNYDETGFWPRWLSDLEASHLYNGGAGITFGDPNMPP